MQNIDNPGPGRVGKIKKANAQWARVAQEQNKKRLGKKGKEKNGGTGGR